MTEIELYKNGPGENIIIRRDIKKDNTSDFRVNGDKVPHKKVLQIIRDMNIQVDNLVQFLPQDRVCKFAELRPNELLIETEKAVGSQEMLELHNRLIELRTKQKTLNVTCEQQHEHLINLKKKNETLERDVLRFNQRQMHLKKS